MSRDNVDGLACEEALYVITDDGEQSLAGLIAFPAHVRGEDDVVEGVEGIVGHWGLSLLYVEAGAGDAMLLQRFDKGRFVDESAARGVDEEGCGLHQGESLGIDDVSSLRLEGAVERDVVALAKEFL